MEGVAAKKLENEVGERSAKDGDCNNNIHNIDIDIDNNNDNDK